MPKFMDLTGQPYGRLTVLRLAPKRGTSTYWLCRCECGAEFEVQASALRSGHTKSCGCLHREKSAETCRKRWEGSEEFREGFRNRTVKRNTKHGLAKTPEYHVWKLIVQRCTNPNNTDYRRYGGRGITVCDRWRNSFEAFYEDMGPRPDQRHEIDRKDNEKGYEPGNCHWVTHKRNCRNRRRQHLITFNGQTRTLAEWAEITGIKYLTIYMRIARLGWSVEEALTTRV